MTQWKSSYSMQKENRLKGFSFNSSCTKFIITSHKKAYRWAYDLGYSWSPELQPNIYEWFFRFFEPSAQCLRYFRQDYISKARHLSKQDNYFYLFLVLSFFRGLKARGLVDINFLVQEWNKMRHQAKDYFYLDDKYLPESI